LKENDADANMDLPSVDNKGIADCGCLYQIVSPRDSGVVFQELDPQEEYFPMVARDYDQAFFGVPPEAIRPTAPQPADNPESQQLSQPASSTAKSITAENIIPTPAAFQSAESSSDQYSSAGTDNTDDEQEGENSISMVVSFTEIIKEIYRST